MSLVRVHYIGEGPTDAAIARALIRSAGGEPGTDYVTPRRGRGKDSLDSRLAGMNVAARWTPVLALRDLDRDAPCPGELAGRLLPSCEAGMCLRIVVRSAEAWLMADRRSFAGALGVDEKLVPPAPEEELHPKQTIVELARRSRHPHIRHELVPAPRSGLVGGPALAAWLSGFAEQTWSPRRAAASGCAPSLGKALLRTSELVGRARGGA